VRRVLVPAMDFVRISAKKCCPPQVEPRHITPRQSA